MQKCDKESAGFTLIELVVAVSIIGILTAIAYPTYLDQVRKSRRSDAHTALTQLANSQEKFYWNCNSYTRFILAGSATAAVSANCNQANSTLGYNTTTSSNGYYNLSINPADANGYTLRATATGAQLEDTACRTLTLTSTGQKTSADSGGMATTKCW